jgi:hypothetical protein
VCSFFFYFVGGWPLHNVQSLILCSPVEVLTMCFVISSSVTCLKVLLSVLLLPRHNHSSWPWSLIPLMHSGCAWRLFPNIHLLGVPVATLSLRGPWRLCPSCVAGEVQQIVPLPAVANFFWDPALPWVCFFSYWRHPTARCEFPYYFFSAPDVSTEASSLGHSWCSAMAYAFPNWPPILWCPFCSTFLWRHPRGLHFFQAGLHFL